MSKSCPDGANRSQTAGKSPICRRPRGRTCSACKRSSTCPSRWFQLGANVRSWLAEAARREFSTHMGRFVFPLQPLLDARGRKEEEKRRAFASAKAARDASVRDLDRLSGALRIGGRALHECAMMGST